MVFHENRLLADDSRDLSYPTDDSREISHLIFSNIRKDVAKVVAAAVVIGVLKVKIVLKIRIDYMISRLALVVE